MTLSSFTCSLNRFSRIVWFSVSKYFDRSRTTALVYPFPIYYFILNMASFAPLPGR